DEARRQLYVAMTRAKSDLNIHLNGNTLDNITVPGMDRLFDRASYAPPDHLTLQLCHKDIILDHFLTCQYPIAQLRSGEALAVDGQGCRTRDGRVVLRFSKKFADLVASRQKENFVPVRAVIRYIVYWHKENDHGECRILLPEIQFEYRA
ncbi:MAG TPA: hypothetical protein DD727_00640, partial [Clostridiales bacterium]|nr:hypothetical protein [Clostridiales bacterium]